MRWLFVLLVAFGAIGVTVQSSPRTVRAGAALQRHPVLTLPHPLGQHDGHTPGSVNVPGTVLAVDGAVNPDAVSDERAYDLFLASMAKTTSDRAFDVALQRSGLAATDRLAFRSALGALDSELKTVQARRGRDANADVTQQQRVVLDNARSRVQASLSAAGRVQLDNYIRTEVKKRVRIYRGPMPSPSNGRTQ